MPNWEHNEGREATFRDVEAILNKIRPPSSSNPPVLGLNLQTIQRATQGGYPVHLYHESLDPVLALREDQEVELAKLGYVRNYIPRNYPRTMFRLNLDPRFEAKFDQASGQQITADHVEERIARNKEHEQTILKEKARPGLEVGPWVYRLQDVELPETASGEDPALTIARLEGQLSEAREAAAARGKK